MAMMRVGVLFLCLCLTPVWAISYTVQLFASSDQGRATQLQAELAGQDYPAYLFSVPTAQGQVYRIRVGAFGNRAAAALFAEVLPSVDGSTPSPALAEGGVPPGFIPLQPALLGQYDLETTLVQIFPWPVIESATPESTPEEANETVTIEDSNESAEDSSPTQDSATAEEETTAEETTAEEDASTLNEDDESSSEPATETENEAASEPTASDEATSPETTEEATTENAEPTVDEDAVAQAEPETTETEQEPEPMMVIRVQPRDASEQARYRIGNLEFEAWRATPLEDGWILRVRSFSVWPDDWLNASEAEREQYRETVLANLSADLDLTPQQLEPFVFELEDQAPFVVLAERFNPETQQIEKLRSIGQPRPNQDNWGLTLYGPSTFLGEEVDIPLPDETAMFEPDERTPVPETLSGNGYQARSDGDFITLSVDDKTWRAAVGQPLWASGDLLLSFYEGQILLYQILKP